MMTPMLARLPRYAVPKISQKCALCAAGTPRPVRWSRSVQSISARVCEWSLRSAKTVAASARRVGRGSHPIVCSARGSYSRRRGGRTCQRPSTVVATAAVMRPWRVRGGDMGVNERCGGEGVEAKAAVGWWGGREGGSVSVPAAAERSGERGVWARRLERGCCSSPSAPRFGPSPAARRSLARQGVPHGVGEVARRSPAASGGRSRARREEEEAAAASLSCAACEARFTTTAPPGTARGFVSGLGGVSRAGTSTRVSSSMRVEWTRWTRDAERGGEWERGGTRRG